MDKLVKELRFFDCNASFGKRDLINPGSFYELEELIKRYQHYGVKNALVYSNMSRQYSPSEGNQNLILELKNHDFLFPVWTVMPQHTGEFPELDQLINEMKINNVKAVNIFHSGQDQYFSLDEWNCGELLCSLEKHNIPLILGAERLSWNELYTLCQNHPKLNVILTGLHFSVNRNLYPIMKKCKNLHIETSGYKVHNGIEEICETFGANKLVFGTGMPVCSGSAAIATVCYARVSRKEKEMIAGRNLEELLGGVFI